MLITFKVNALKSFKTLITRSVIYQLCTATFLIFPNDASKNDPSRPIYTFESAGFFDLKFRWLMGVFLLKENWKNKNNLNLRFLELRTMLVVVVWLGILFRRFRC